MLQASLEVCALNLKSVLINMGDGQRNKLIDSAIVKIANADSSGRLTEDLIDLILNLNGKVQLLRDKNHRTKSRILYMKKT